MGDLPAFVPTTRAESLRVGAAFIKCEIQRLRAQALSADGHPHGAQHTVEPSAEAERIMLGTLHLAQAYTTLLEMARHEEEKP